MDLPVILSRTDKRVFELGVLDDELTLFESDCGLVPGSRGDFFLVGGERIFVLAAPGIELTAQILSEVGGCEGITRCPPGLLNGRDLSYMTPLAVLERIRDLESVESDDRWRLRHVVERILQTRTEIESENPWLKGLLLAGAQDAWNSDESFRVEGESFWGWALQSTQSPRETGIVPDESRRKQMSAWINVARTFLINEYDIEWVRQYRWGDFLLVPISKCIRAVGMTRSRLMTPRMIAALLNDQVSVNKLRHVLGMIEALPSGGDESPSVSVVESHSDTLRERVQEAEAELVAEEWESSEEFVSNPPGMIEREFDEEMGVFGYWHEGRWTDAFVIVSPEDECVKNWVEEVVAATGCRVRRFSG